MFYYLLRTHVHQQRRAADYTGLGLALGCGLLTKAFFVPVGAGAAAFLAWSAYGRDRTDRPGRGPSDPASWRHIAACLTIAVGVPLLLSAPWFLMFWHRYGMLLGSSETFHFSRLPAAPGDSLGVMAFAREALRDVAAFGKTFLWCGTWSWIKRPYWAYALMAPLLLLAVAGLARRRNRPTEPAARQVLLTAAFLLLPVLAGFVYHVYLRVRWTGVGSGTSGYYLFFAWPAVGVLLGQALETRGSPRAKALLVAALGLALAFELSGLWFSAEVFTGIVRTASDSKMGIGGLFPTPGNVGLVYGRLAQIALPGAAVACYAVSLISRLVVVGLLLRLPPRE